MVSIDSIGVLGIPDSFLAGLSLSRLEKSLFLSPKMHLIVPLGLSVKQ